MSKIRASHLQTSPRTSGRLARTILLACLSALVLGAALCPESALAQASPVPLACNATKPKLALKYNRGLTVGQQKADALFAAADVNKNVTKLRKKLNRVLDRLYVHVREAWDEEVGDGRRCRVQGLADGFLSRLSALLGECILDGAQWGQFAATVYCELSVELDGLASPASPFVRPPTALCGSMFEQVCDDSYAYVGSEGTDRLQPVVKKFIEQRGTTVQPYPGCLPYTEGEYEDVFSESKNIDCAYGSL